MKRILAAIAITLVCLCACVSNGAIIFYEGFDYAAGNLAGNGVWTNANMGDEVVVASGSLSVGGLAASSGNMATFGGMGMDPQRPFTSQSSSVWYSFAFRIDDLGSLNTSGGYFGGVGSSTTFQGATVWVRSDGAGGFDIGISQRSDSAPVWSGANYSVSSTLFLVGNYLLNSGDDNDQANLWINPSSASFGSENAPSGQISSFGANNDLDSINRFFLRQATDINEAPGLLSFDELRVGQSWADVTPIPEPAEWGLLCAVGLLGVCGLHAWRERRRASRQLTSVS
jgi:hypothetical protein